MLLDKIIDLLSDEQSNLNGILLKTKSCSMTSARKTSQNG